MNKNHIISIGIDTSLTGTGVIVLNDGKIVGQKLIKSKPVPDGKPIDEVRRIETIVGEIFLVVKEHKPQIAVIEGLAFMVKNTTALVQLSALNYFTRSMLMKNGVPFVIVAPTSLKKFITGNGASKKDVMLMETFKRYGVTILDDNENDAYGLAQVGLALLGGNSKSTTKLQEEVLLLLQKQI
jgi:Holliday junction resolvasome RuvABC endonuclease subunit